VYRKRNTFGDEGVADLTHKGNLKWIRTIGEAEMIKWPS